MPTAINIVIMLPNRIINVTNYIVLLKTLFFSTTLLQYFTSHILYDMTTIIVLDSFLIIFCVGIVLLLLHGPACYIADTKPGAMGTEWIRDAHYPLRPVQCSGWQ